MKVPTKNLVGKENEGFKYVMLNFNHERFVLAAMSNRYARVCLEDAWKYAVQRKAFGKTLIEQPVRINFSTTIAFLTLALYGRLLDLNWLKWLGS